MLDKLEKLRAYLISKGLEPYVNSLKSLSHYSGLEAETLGNDTLSIIDLIGNYETGVVLKDKKPQHVISYSDDPDSGKGFTDEAEDELNKKALGLFDVPPGYPDGNVAHRPRDKYEQQDKEVAESFFGAESNIDTEESSPPANIERCDNKPINILEQTEFEDFFSFLNSADEKLKRKTNKDLGATMNTEQRELGRLAKALTQRGHTKQAATVRKLQLVKESEEKTLSREAQKAADIRTIISWFKAACSVGVKGECKFSSSEIKEFKAVLEEDNPHWEIFTTRVPSKYWRLSGSDYKLNPNNVKGAKWNTKLYIEEEDMGAWLGYLDSSEGQLKPIFDRLSQETQDRVSGKGGAKYITITWLVPEDGKLGNGKAISPDAVAYWTSSVDDANRLPELTPGTVVPLQLLQSRVNNKKVIEALKIFQVREGDYPEGTVYEYHPDHDLGENIVMGVTKIGDTWLFAQRSKGADDSTFVPIPRPDAPRDAAKTSDALDSVFSSDRALNSALTKNAYKPKGDGKKRDETKKKVEKVTVSASKEGADGNWTSSYTAPNQSIKPGGNPVTVAKTFADQKSADNYAKTGTVANEVKPDPARSKARITSASFGEQIHNNTEGDEFRAWAVKTYNPKKDATKVELSNYGNRTLDDEGKWNNTYMVKAWALWGKAFTKHKQGGGTIGDHTEESDGEATLPPTEELLTEYLYLKDDDGTIAKERYKLLSDWGRIERFKRGPKGELTSGSKSDVVAIMARKPLKDQVIAAFRIDNEGNALASRLSFSAIDRANLKAETDAAATAATADAAEKAKAHAPMNMFFIVPATASLGPDGQYPLKTVFVSRGDGSQGPLKLGAAFFMGLKEDGKTKALYEIELRRRAPAARGGQGGPANITEAEGKAVVDQQATAEEKKAWAYYFNMYSQAVESDTESQTGFGSMFRDSRDTEYEYLRNAEEVLEVQRKKVLKQQAELKAKWEAERRPPKRKVKPPITPVKRKPPEVFDPEAKPTEVPKQPRQ